MYFTDSTALTSQLVLILTGTKAPFVSSLAAFHSILHIYGKHIAAMACTFNSPLTSQVNGAVPTFAFFPNNANHFGITTSITHS